MYSIDLPTVGKTMNFIEQVESVAFVSDHLFIGLPTVGKS
jgi:hypothetical protein